MVILFNMRVISGEKRHLLLKTLSNLDIRPTTDKIKETLFNMIQFDLNDINFLDLYAGSGAIGIEALSRGARFATFVDNNNEAIKIINENLAHTGLLEKSNVYRNDVLIFLQNYKTDIKYDIVFIDPPYESGLYEQTLYQLSQSTIIKEDSTIIVESNKELDFSFATEYGFNIVKEKIYKTNKHVFLRK